MCGSPVANRGFSLLEAVVALAVVGLTAVAALAALGTELRTAGRVRQGLEAHALAETKLAAVRLLALHELRPLADSLRRGQFPRPFEGYRWEVSSQDARGHQDLIDVGVTVRWEGGAYALTTRLYRPAPVLRVP